MVADFPMSRIGKQDNNYNVGDTEMGGSFWGSCMIAILGISCLAGELINQYKTLVSEEKAGWTCVNF